MNQIENNLKLALQEAIKKSFDLDVSDILIERPKDLNHGDYASNVAMKICKLAKMKPIDVANTLVSNIDLAKASIEKIEIAGPGFMNFFISSNTLTQVINKVLMEKENYGKSNAGKGMKINVEYVSANPTGDLHPGHARGAAMGDSITRLMKMAGYDVTREYYINDAGNQIHNMAKSLQARYLQVCGIDAQVPEDGYHGPDLVEIAKELYAEVKDAYVEDNQANYEFFRQYGLNKELDKLKADLKAFNVEFDVWTSEKSLYDRGLVEKSLDTLKANGYTYEAEGALWLKTTLFNDDKDRVLVKSDGSYTYLTPDIAYHLNKLDRGYDKLIDLLGADHHSYITRLKAAIQALGYEADKLDVDIIQMARMIKDGQEFKLSKRSGKAVSLRDLLDEAGSDAVRYFFVSRAADTQMDFDLDMATKQSNENPVYYAQYAHARMCSILRQAQDIELANHFNLIKHEKELTLLKQINEFTNVVIDCATTRMPHKMCNYIQKLASDFHSFYNECKVIDKNNLELSAQRLALVEACRITLNNALNSIGVSAPEKM